MNQKSLHCQITQCFILIVSFLLIFYGPAHAAEQEIKLSIKEPARVGCFEKVMMRIDIDQNYLNPYDPNEVDLVVEIKNPNAQIIQMPAFYYQPFEYKALKLNEREMDWFYPTGEPYWVTRFAPQEPGVYQATAILQGRVATQRSAPISLEASESDNPGFLRVSSQNPRYFEFSNGSSFFPIGQNLAFISPGQYMTPSKAQKALVKMGENGANFARVWACSEDWAMAIESRKSAWGRGWDWNAPIALPPGRDSYSHDYLALRLEGGKTLKPQPITPIALRPNTQYALYGKAMSQAKTGGLRVNGQTIEMGKPNEWKPFVYSFTTGADQWWLDSLQIEATGSDTLWIRDLSLREAAGGPELFPELDPNQPLRGRYSQQDSFWMDMILETAEQQGIYLQPVLLTRDHYMDALKDSNSPEYQRAIHDAQNLLRYAVARWGYSTHIAAWEYFNEQNPGLPNERFYRELGLYLEQVDPYKHLRTTSAWGPSPADYRHEELDIANEHYYMRPVKTELWKDEVESIAQVASEFLRHISAKPAMLAEFGLATNEWGQSPYLKQDLKGHLFHRSLWASAMSGLSGTVQFWWWETIDQHQWYPHYRPVSLFLKEIPFIKKDLKSYRTTSHSGRSQIMGLNDSTYSCAWISDASANWHAFIAEGQTPQPVVGEEMDLPALQEGHYNVQWWDTGAGKIMQEFKIEIRGENHSVTIPDYTSDIACLVIPVKP